MTDSLREEQPSDEETTAESLSALSNASGALQDEELERLRQILFSREIALLKELARNQGEKEFNTRKVSEVLAESIILRTGKDHQLNLALEPVVDDILKSSLQRRKDDFINVLFPLIGPVIRKSIAENFVSMLGNFSKSMEIAFSWRGLKWRFEAWRSGKTFSEIVMLHSVVYRVEQVFFIHSETGLALSHVLNEEVSGQDADMVSGMLTAIQDFARDSFLNEGDNSNLESLQLGDLSLLIEKTDVAYLACVVRGTPPADFRALLQDTLNLMLIEYATPLAEFSGDTSPFLSSVRYLQPLLLSQYAEEEKGVPLWAKVVPVVLIVGLLSWGGYTFYSKMTRTRLLEKAVLSLNGHPGIMVTNVIEHKDAPWEVLAFRDPLAPKPETILREKGFAPDLLDLKAVPFVSHAPAIILQRVKNAILPPETVSMDLKEDGTLVLAGHAPLSWIVYSREAAAVLPGVSRVDISGLRDPLIEDVLALVEDINRVSIRFPLGGSQPVPEDAAKLEAVVDNLVKLEKIAKKSNLSVSLTVYGHADSIGSERRNYEISQNRTKTVAARLYARGSSIPVVLYGMGSEFLVEGDSDGKGKKLYEPDQASRRIELRVSLSRTVTADSLFEDNREK